MTSVNPWSVVHRGMVPADGFFFAFDITGKGEAIDRILSAWEPNAQVYRLRKGFVLLLPRPILVPVDETIGLPLVRCRGFLIGMPLTEKEIDAVGQPFRNLVLSEGGRISTQELNDEGREAVHKWIDTAGLEFVQGRSLGNEPPGPVVAKVPELLNIRETLGRIPEAPLELKNLLARLKGEPESYAGRKFDWLRGFSFRSMVGAAQSFVRGLRSLWPRNAYETQSLTGSQQGVFATRAPSRLSLWLTAAVNKIVMVTRLARVLGWRQGRYLSRVMQMFEQGDVDEALRHAIPLSSISDSPVLRMAFGLPGARQNLRLNPFGRGPSSTMILGQSLYSYLHQLYRSTFKRLEAQGRIGEAAFVLAELMRANEEAVAFLERHGRLREAAEIAEARELAPEIIVRQWFVAGEKGRAIQVARKTGAFQGAVLRLEKSRHPAASELRKLWAQSLADAGNVAVAVDIIWPLESERSTAIEWMRRAAAMGGRPGARSLARLISMAHGGYREWSQALELLQSDSQEEASSRMEFSEILRKEPQSPQTQTLARLAARAILRDAGQGLQWLGPIPLRQLIDYSGDGALRADVPPRFPGRKVELKDLGAVRRYSIRANDRGSTQISEAVLLPNGTCAVAMGEVGLKLITRDGRRIAHFDEPADRVVASENGSKMITMARRGAVWSLSKVDVQSRKAAPWCHAEINRFAKSFDGATWYVVSGQDLYAIDTTSPRLDALWRIPDLGHFVGPLTLASTKLEFVTYKDKDFWLWEYQLPQLRLKNKTLLPFSRPLETVREIRLGSCSDSGVLDCSSVLASQATTSTESENTSARQILFRKTNGSWNEFLALGTEEQVLFDPLIAANWLAVCLASKAATRILVYSYTKGAKPVLRIEIAIEGSCNPSVRFDGSLLTIADDLGHLRAYELTYGEEIRDLNI